MQKYLRKCEDGGDGQQGRRWKTWVGIEGRDVSEAGRRPGPDCSFVHCRGRDSLYRVLNHMRMTTATQSSEKTIDGGVEQMLLSSQVIVWVGWVLGDGK